MFEDLIEKKEKHKIIIKEFPMRTNKKLSKEKLDDKLIEELLKVAEKIKI